VHSEECAECPAADRAEGLDAFGQATGRSFAIAGIDIYRVASGSICEHWHVIDQLSMLGQLGLLPAPATP
jgi:predicted ester cyclase